MSAPWPARRSIISIQLLTQLGLDLGLSLDECLHATGLSPVQLTRLNGDVEARSELRLIANLIEALPAVADLGLQAGRRYHLTTYGAWGYAILSSATVRQAAELGLRYHGLTYAFTGISLNLDKAVAHLNFDDGALPPALRDFIVQRDMLGAMVVVRELLGTPLRLLTVELRQAAPEDVSPFIAAFGQVPHFGAARNRLGFAADLRNFDVAAQILDFLGVSSVKLMTNNPRKVDTLSQHGVKIDERVPVRSDTQSENERYLATKARKLGHHIDWLG